MFLESIAYQTRDVLKFMEEDFEMRLKELRVDGGAAANDTAKRKFVSRMSPKQRESLYRKGVGTRKIVRREGTGRWD